MSKSTQVRRNGVYIKRRTNAIRRAVGFTTKSSPSAPADGIRRVRLVDAITGNETRVRVDQFNKTYSALLD